MGRQNERTDLWGVGTSGVFFYASSFTYGSFIHSMLRPPLSALFLPAESASVARLATSRPAALSVPEGAIGIPLLFLCPAEPPYLLPSRVVLPGGVWRCGVVRLTTPGNRHPGVFC